MDLIEISIISKMHNASSDPSSRSARQADVAVIGAGLAGLTAAHELKTSFGVDADVYEGNTRVGGRCFTARGIFAQGQIAEHGGELIDSDHHAIRSLAHELGLPKVGRYRCVQTRQYDHLRNDG